MQRRRQHQCGIRLQYLEVLRVNLLQGRACQLGLAKFLVCGKNAVDLLPCGGEHLSQFILNDLRAHTAGCTVARI
jgi:hypothetical protein